MGGQGSSRRQYGSEARSWSTQGTGARAALGQSHRPRGARWGQLEAEGQRAGKKQWQQEAKKQELQQQGAGGGPMLGRLAVCWLGLEEARMRGVEVQEVGRQRGHGEQVLLLAVGYWAAWNSAAAEGCAR